MADAIRITSSWMLHDMEAHTVVTVEKPGRFIALCDGKHNTEEENKAHTRLVIAAPSLMEALETIAKGKTNKFPGAPDIMNTTQDEFRRAMWSWSQKVASAALAQVTNTTKDGE